LTKHFENIPAIQQIANQIYDVAIDLEDVLLAILFGSAAKARLRQDSDIDIAIAGQKPKSWDQLQEYRILFSRKIHREIDLIDLNQSRGLIFYEAMTKGKGIISKDSHLMARLMADTVYFAEDLLPSINRALENSVLRFIHARPTDS
jgi:predicted nucleotidyltransferase